jgi:hypothetical protein
MCLNFSSPRILAAILLTIVGQCAFGASQQGFEARLNALAAAVDAYITASGSVQAPAEWRKVLWFNLAGVPGPSALVVLRSSRDECAAVAASARPCKALIFAGTAKAGFTLVAEFAMLVHPVALVRSPGGTRELLYSRDKGAGPAYARYRFDGETFIRNEDALSSDDLQPLSLLLADDRSMSLIADQHYAARHFPNDRARSAPFRLHYDAVAFQGERNTRGPLGQFNFDASAARILNAIQVDAETWAAALAWPNSLDLRLWSCADWMVERRFWEVEDRRLGRPGTCIEPALFAEVQRISRNDAANDDLVRLSMLNQVGTAWVLRMAPLSLAVRNRLAHQADSGELGFMGSFAGQLLAYERRQMSLERLAEAVAGHVLVGKQWFTVWEKKMRFFVEPTPELRAYNEAFTQVAKAHQCLRKVKGQPPAPGLSFVACDTPKLELARQVAGWLTRDLEP